MPKTYACALGLFFFLTGCVSPKAPDEPQDAGSQTPDAGFETPDAGEPPFDGGTCTQALERGDGPSTSAAWELKTIDTAVHTNAVCNDGTPGVYMLRRNPATTRWVIWLEGGGNCADGASCRQRWNSQSGPALMSSTNARDRAAAGTLQYPASGVFSNLASENPALHDANMVQIQYCSSDLWSGDRAGDLSLPLTNVARWHFRGRAIALAALDELLAQAQLNQATEIVLGGGSAGSAGLFINIDELRARLPAGARVIGLSDGGFQIVYPAYDPVTHTESTQSPTPLELIAYAGHMNWGGRGDESCDAAATDELAHVLCRSPEHLTRGGHISTPVFIIGNQYDFNQTNRLGVDIDRDTGRVADADQAAYVRRFAARMREQLGLVDAHHAIFANYDVFHVTSQSDRALTIEIDGTLERDAIAEWHRDPCSPVRRIEAEISGQPAH